MKTLLLAEACNCDWTSVPLVGFNTVNALRQQMDLTLATHVRNREALQRHEISRRIEIIYVDNEWLAKPLYNLGRVLRGGNALGWTTNMAINWPAYIAFEKTLGRQLKKRLNAGEFDLIHRVTPVSPTLPSPLASMTDVPMVIGPLNGGLPWPKEFPSLRKNEREWLSPIRNIYRQFPWYRSTYRRLAAVISGSRHTASEVPNCFRGKKFYLPENGIDPERFSIATGWTEPTHDFQFVSVGRLVPYKGFDMILTAMAESPILKTCRLLLIGDGPERQRLEQQTAELGLAKQVRFAGWLPQVELAKELRNSQAFVFPSLREFGGGVVLEAMASGLPGIVMDYGGPAELVDDQTGILLKMSPREEIIPQLVRSMEALAIDSDRCRRFSLNSLRKVREQFTWDRKAEKIRSIYDSILLPDQGQRQSSPESAGAVEYGPLIEFTSIEDNALSSKHRQLVTTETSGT